MLTVQRSLKGMPSSNVLSLFHCVFQLIEFKCLQFRHPFTREIPAFKILVHLTIRKVLELSCRAESLVRQKHNKQEIFSFKKAPKSRQTNQMLLW